MSGPVCLKSLSMCLFDRIYSTDLFSNYQDSTVRGQGFLSNVTLTWHSIRMFGQECTPSKSIGHICGVSDHWLPLSTSGQQACVTIIRTIIEINGHAEF